MCGHCCQGAGGIVVGPKDLERLCLHLKMTPEGFESVYGERRSGKLMIRIQDNAYCIFFDQSKGCAVHAAKPDICRAWPFFRGNLVDKDSLEMAKDFCPGICASVTHPEFAMQGLRYMHKHNLLASDKNVEARALCISDEEAAYITGKNHRS